MLSKEAVEEFREIYSKIYGEDLSYEEAARQATSLLRLYRTIVDDDSAQDHPHKEEGKNK